MLSPLVAGNPRRCSGRDLLRDVGISLLYTVVIVALVKLGVPQPIQNYLGSP